MRQRHSIDLLFSLSLLMVFVVCSFLVLLFQINGYHSIINKEEASNALHLPLAYIQTQIRSHDEQGVIDVFHEQGIKGLRILDKESKSFLYIYEQEDTLKELRVMQQMPLDFTTGSALFPIKEFTIKQNSIGFIITLQSQQGETQSIQISTQCK